MTPMQCQKKKAPETEKISPKCVHFTEQNQFLNLSFTFFYFSRTTHNVLRRKFIFFFFAVNLHVPIENVFHEKEKSSMLIVQDTRISISTFSEIQLTLVDHKDGNSLKNESNIGEVSHRLLSFPSLELFPRRSMMCSQHSLTKIPMCTQFTHRQTLTLVLPPNIYCMYLCILPYSS